MNEGEAHYLTVLTFGVLWSVLSATKLTISAREGNKGGAWFWSASFVASSLGAAYFFGRLL